jgi:hypothetical protein
VWRRGHWLADRVLIVSLGSQRVVAMSRNVMWIPASHTQIENATPGQSHPFIPATRACGRCATPNRNDSAPYWQQFDTTTRVFYAARRTLQAVVSDSGHDDAWVARARGERKLQSCPDQVCGCRGNRPLFTSTITFPPLNFRATTTESRSRPSWNGRIQRAVLRPFSATLSMLLIQRSNRTISDTRGSHRQAFIFAPWRFRYWSRKWAANHSQALVSLKQTFLNDFSLISNLITFRMGGSNVEQGQSSRYSLELPTFLGLGTRHAPKV